MNDTESTEMKECQLSIVPESSKRLAIFEDYLRDSGVLLQKRLDTTMQNPSL